MSNLAHRQQKIQEKRKQTPWRTFLMEIASWVSLMFYRHNGEVSKYQANQRVKQVLDNEKYIQHYDDLIAQTPQEITTQPFIQQLQGLFDRFPFPATYQFFGCENTRYGDVIHEAKNVYLSFFVTTGSENVLYSLSVKQSSQDVLNSMFVSKHSQNIYMSLCIGESFNVFYSQNITGSNNIWFSKNLTGCSECLSCDDLINKKYYIENIAYDKEAYLVKKKQLLFSKNNYGTYFDTVVHTKAVNHESKNCTGSYVIQSEDIQKGFLVYNTRKGENVCMVASDLEANNIYDTILGGSGETYDLYGSIGAGICSHLYCSIQCGTCSSMFYSMFCEYSHFCLGCIGLKNKSYCIFNKQYTKEERYEKVDEIFAQMDATPSNSPFSGGGSQLGEFFPATMNPFYFNDTAAYLIDPSFTKEEVTAKGYLRRDEPIKVDIPAGVQTVKNTELDQFEGWRNTSPNPSLKEGNEGQGARGERRIDDEILKKVILDEEGNAYRVIPMEYNFLMKYGLPLPRKHWLERMKENFRIS